MTNRKAAAPGPHIVWIHAGRLENVLSAATHLETTRELRNLGATVTLFAHGEEAPHTHRGVEVQGMPSGEMYLLGQASFHSRVWGAIREMKPPPDIVLFHQVSTLWILPRIRWRHFRGDPRPLAVMDTRSVHMPPKTGEGLRGRLRRYYFETMNRCANRWCDGQTAITERMARRVRIPESDLWGVWPSGVDPSAFRVEGERRWPEANEDVRLIYIGSLHRERNLVGLARAVLQARQDGARVMLSLVGEGDSWAELEGLARESPEGLELAPSVPHEAVPRLLADHHVGVLPFPDEEKFRVSSPIKLFEYLASGLPILATRVACHTDVLEGSSCVFWAESGEISDLQKAVQALGEARNDLPAMSDSALEEAVSWSWQSSARKLFEAVRSGLARSDVGS